MATTDDQRATLTIPAAYVDDARAAILEEIRSSGDALADAQTPEDTSSSAKMLARELAVLEQLREDGEAVTVEAEHDGLSSPLGQLLDEMARLLTKRLAAVCVFGPVPMGDVRQIAEQLGWVANEAVALSRNDELGTEERQRITDRMRSDRYLDIAQHALFVAAMEREDRAPILAGELRRFASTLPVA